MRRPPDKTFGKWCWKRCNLQNALLPYFFCIAMFSIFIFLYFSVYLVPVFLFSVFPVSLFLFEKVKIRDCKYNGDEGGKWWENLNEDDLCFPRISLLIGLPWNSSFFELPEQRQWSSLMRGNDLTWSDFWRGHALPHQPHPSPLPPPQKSQLSSLRQHLEPHHGSQYNISRYGGVDSTL